MKKPMISHFCFMRPDDFAVKSSYGRLQVKNAIAHYRDMWTESANREIPENNEDLDRARLGERQRQLADRSDAQHYLRLCDRWDVLLKEHSVPAEDEEIEKLFA